MLLRNEFHDILPGSSIREVYEVAEAELGGVVAAASAVAADQPRRDRRPRRPAGRPARASSSSTPTSRRGRSALVSPGPLPGGQAVEGGSVLAGDATVPGLTAAVIVDAGRATGAVTSATGRLENALLRVEIDADGTLASVFDKRAGREALAGRGNQIWAYVDKPRNWDAWDIEEDYAAQGEEIAARRDRGRRERPAPRRDPGRPPLPRQRRSCRPCALWANSARLEFRTDIDWHERRILLKARFPLADPRPTIATFECAHGVIRRADPPQHLLGRGPLRGGGASLRRPLRARLRRRAAQRRQVRPPRPRQRARPQPAALAGLSRPARRRGPAELHLRALPARRRLADRRRARRGRGPEPAAPLPRRVGGRRGELDRGRPCPGLALGLSGFKPRRTAAG